MWSHYAAKHTGVVFEFEIPAERVKNSYETLLPFPVEYSQSRPIVDFDNNPIEKHLLTKSLDWAYEEEERVLEIEKGPGIYSFRPTILRSVIMGLNFDCINRKIISEILDSRNKREGYITNLYQVEMVKEQFKLYIPNHDIYSSPEW